MQHCNAFEYAEVSLRLRFGLAQIAQSPKSTVVGLCVLALAAERGVHFDAQGNLAMSSRDWFDLGCGVLTAIVGGLSRDADSPLTRLRLDNKMGKGDVGQ